MKQSQIFKRIKLPCIAFAVVGVLYALYFALFGFYPFGRRTVAWCDMEQQYVPLIMELRNIIWNGDSVLLGRGGGGMNLWGVILFFVSSPLSILSLLVSAEKMIYFVNILTLLKLSLCGASASFGFSRLFERLAPSFNVLLSVMYAFSGYVMMYYQNNMWLDMMMIFPLILLSMFRLCEKKKWGAYTIVLSLAVFMNFYISYMLILFIVISFGVMMIFCCKRENRQKCAVMFISADIIALLITAVVWLPSFKQFSSSGRGESVSELFCTGTFFEDWQDKLALISCTPLVIAAVVIIVFRRKLFTSGRAAFFAIMTPVMLIGAFIDSANKIWHTGSYQAYPLRYGFIIIYLGLCVSAVLLSGIEGRREKIGSAQRMFFVMAAYIIAVIPGIIFRSRLDSYTSSLWVRGNEAAAAVAYGAVGTVVYAVYIMCFRKGRISRRLTAVLMCIAVLCETLLNFSIYMGNTRDVTERFDQTMELCGKIHDESFYRVKSTKRYFYSNMMEAMGFSSIGHYTSLTDKDFLFAAKKLGYSAYWLDISTNGGTIVTDAFLMNKYIFGVNGDWNDLCERYNSDGLFEIYRNAIVPDGAVISRYSPDELMGFDNTQRMESSEYLAEKLWGAADIMKKAEPYAYTNLSFHNENGRNYFEIGDPSKKSSINYSFFVEGVQELYFDLFSNYSTSLTEPYFGSVSIYVNGNLIEEEYPNKRSSGIVDLGSFENKYVSVSVDVHNDFEVDEFGLYMLDANKFSRCVSDTETGKINLNGNKLMITAECTEEGWIYIPFAYSDGYGAELNGEKVTVVRALGDFMAVKLAKGENDLVLTYYPSGFVAGAVISASGILLFIIAVFFLRGIKFSGKIVRASEKFLIFASISVMAGIYMISALLWIFMKL